MTTRYAAVHESPKGPGDARPTAMQIIENESLQGQWTDKVALVTGCSSGIGVETARALYETGATLFLTARNLAKAKTAPRRPRREFAGDFARAGFRIPGQCSIVREGISRTQQQAEHPHL